MTTAVDKPKADQHLKVDHREGCPATRVETFTSDRPRSAQYPLGGRVKVTRCVDCGRDNHQNVKENHGDEPEAED